MASQIQTPTPHLDEYLKGIKDEFDRLNHELDETRKQRDEFKTKCKSRRMQFWCERVVDVLIDRKQVKELQELRQTISSRENNTVPRHGQDIADACGVTDDNPSPLISTVSSSGEYYSPLDGEDAALHNPEILKGVGYLEGEGNQEDDENEIDSAPITGLGTASHATGHWAGEFNSNSSTTTLNLNLVHKLTLEGRIRVAFSVDGKHLATASSLGIVSIFDLKTGKRIR